MILEDFVPDAAAWRLIVLVCLFLVGVHAYRKLSPYFALTWLGSGLLFGMQWGEGGSALQLPASVKPEVVALPVLLFYLAAAVTKGLVETRDGLRGNHLVHVLMTGVFGGVIALPLESAARTTGWQLPSTGAPTGSVVSPAIGLGGVPLAVVAGWAVAATAFYGTYKLLDHVGLSKALQTVVLFAAMPFLVKGVEALNAMI